MKANGKKVSDMAKGSTLTQAETSTLVSTPTIDRVAKELKFSKMALDMKVNGV